MKSPFPGMDPFIESSRLWPDFHDDLIAEIKRALAARLPEQYAPRIASREYVTICYSEEDCLYPTPAHVVAACAPPPGPQRARSDDEPLTMRAFFAESHREPFLTICDLDNDSHVVTHIEVLSPSNKRKGTEGWDQYLRKRNALLLGQAHFVEIDLLRGGQRMPMVEPWPNSPYYLLLGRQSRVPYCRVWPCPGRQPLPEIPVPLASPDPDIPLALQPLIAAVYERSRYARRLDYTRPLTPPLPAEETAWLEQRLRQDTSP